MKKIIPLFLLLLCGCLLFSCSHEPTPTITQCGKVTANDITVYFETNGGNTIDPILVKAGTDFADIEIPTPVREGYDFEYWADENGSERMQRRSWAEVQGVLIEDYSYYYAFEDCTESEIYFYAAWRRPNATLTFSASGGYFDLPDGTKPEKVVYHFSDLKNDYDEYTLWDFIERKQEELYKLAVHEKYNKQVSSSYSWTEYPESIYKKLKAGKDFEINFIWEPEIVITFETNTGSKVEDYVAYSSFEGDVLYNADYIPVKDEYVFAGWYYDPKFSTVVVSQLFDESRVLYAKWVPKNYDVTESNLKQTIDSLESAMVYTTQVSYSIMYAENFSEYVDKQSFNIHYTGNFNSSVIDIFKEALANVRNGISAIPIFMNLDLSDVDISEIPEKCFYECFGLYTITLPETISKIRAQAFDRCTSLSNLTLPTSITEIGGSAFYKCTSLENVVIPQGCVSIGASAFCMCEKFTDITLPENIVIINATLFYGCSNLEKVIIPSGVTSIGSSAFSNCEKLETLTIPSSVTQLGSSAFSGCKKLKNVDISNILEIPSEAFYGCEALENPTFSQSLTEINASAFRNCSSITQITLPSGLTSLKSYAFNNCNKLEKINIPKGIKRIPEACFDGCTALKELTFEGEADSALKNIDDRAFASCTSLKTIALPEKLQVIDICAFINCSSVESFTIPASAMRIGCGVFKGCSKLQKITFENASGWRKTNYSVYKNGTVESLDDEEKNVTIFIETDCNKFWYTSGTPDLQ